MLKMIYLTVSLLLAVSICFGQDSSTTYSDEFEEFKTDSAITTLSSPEVKDHKKSSPSDIYWTSGVLLFTVLAGILIRFKKTRQLRSLFLVLSIIILGFYRGSCPCSIQSFQNGILLFTGNFIRWPSIILFLGLLLITYLFGRVYCGWICHLGALQEFIFNSSSFKLFQSDRSQKIMRYIRVTALFVLVSQLLVMQTNLYKTVDPFAVVYNFYSDYLIGWILVFIVIASSFVLYRPFCKTFCPVGLVLGWISKIPGASVLSVKQNCISCVKCNKGCTINAITRDSKISVLDNQECIRCGECLNGCPKDAISLSRKNRMHPAKVRLSA